MGVKMARQAGEGHLVRKEPKDLSEFRPEKLKEAYDAFESSETDSEDEESAEEVQAQEEDDWNDVGDDRQTRRTKERNKKKDEWYAKKTESRKPKLASSEAAVTTVTLADGQEIDNEEEGGEWVTMENLYSHIAHGDTAALNLLTQDPLPEIVEEFPAFPEDAEAVVANTENPAPKEEVKIEKKKDEHPKKVVFLTSDFAM